MTTRLLRPIAMLAASVLTLAAAPGAVPAQPRLTVVELFTSQGCSSCPPANDNLAALAARPDIVALSFGVTYWDQLGWKDSFAHPAYTSRQYAYAASFGRRQVATPEMVVNGRADVVGNRRPQIDALLKKLGPIAGPSVTVDADEVSIGAGPARATPADVWLVSYDPRTIQVPVRAGENGGKTLPHRNVVRSLVRLGEWNGSARTFSLPASAPTLAGVVLVQAAKVGPILAAARV